MSYTECHLAVLIRRDAGAYNLAGSTEHVELHLKDLRRDAVAYIDIGAAVTGPDLELKSSPVLRGAMLRALERVLDPAKNQTLRATFAGHGGAFSDLDAAGDFAAFEMLAGCSSGSMAFTGRKYPDQSCYDTLDWVEQKGDPGFSYHRAMTQALALLLVDLVDQELIPFDFEDFASATQDWLKGLEQLEPALNYTSLHAATDEFRSEAHQFHDWSNAWRRTVYEEDRGAEGNALAAARLNHNSRMALFETNLLDLAEGNERQQFRHVLFGPAWDGPNLFPTIRQALHEKDGQLAQQQVDRVAGILSHAASRLNH